MINEKINVKPKSQIKIKFLRLIMLILVFAIFVQMLGAPSLDYRFSQIKAQNELIENKRIEREKIEKENRYIITTSLLTQEVKNYIAKYSNYSKVEAEKLIEICDLYNLDIKFVLAQGHLESNFGTKGIAKRTNSVFNVGTYDNGKILYRYKNPNESIEPYAKLIISRYKINKTEYDLLQHRKFVDKDGKRYASAKNYENKLRHIVERITTETIIDSLQIIRSNTGLLKNINDTLEISNINEYLTINDTNRKL